MSTYEKQIILKVLNPIEELNYILEGILPEDFEPRYNKYKKENPTLIKHTSELQKLQRELKGKCAGLTKDQYHISPNTKWVAQAVVLPVMETTCKKCGSKTRAVMGKPLVESIHPLLGVKQELYHQFDNIDTLPKQTHIYYQEVPTCESCFPAKEIIKHISPGIISYDN